MPQLSPSRPIWNSVAIAALACGCPVQSLADPPASGSRKRSRPAKCSEQSPPAKLSSEACPVRLWGPQPLLCIPEVWFLGFLVDCWRPFVILNSALISLVLSELLVTFTMPIMLQYRIICSINSSNRWPSTDSDRSFPIICRTLYLLIRPLISTSHWSPPHLCSDHLFFLAIPKYFSCFYPKEQFIHWSSSPAPIFSHPSASISTHFKNYSVPTTPY